MSSIKKYTHLFFDLDGTLWDLHRNTRVAMEQLYRNRGFESEKFESFFHRYHHHNDKVWALYRDGKIEKSLLRTVRFERAFADVEIPMSETDIDHFATEFLDVCPRQPLLLPNTIDLLEHCQGRYPMYIITNGFQEVQAIKMEVSGLGKYFQRVILSEEVGVRKPHREIFDFAMEVSGATAETSLMIGDDWDADILGARDYGMDQVFITATEHSLDTQRAAWNGTETNAHNISRHNYKPTYTINNLAELIPIL
jgi:putative hydrolase of the HAD superfamily